MSDYYVKKADEIARDVISRICSEHIVCAECPLSEVFDNPKYKNVLQPCLNSLIDFYYEMLTDERGRDEKSC